MTLYQVIQELQHIAKGQHNIMYTGEGDLYRDLNAQASVKYDIFYITQNQHSTENDFDRYSFNLFYISRLSDVDGENALQIQSIGKEVLNNIIKTFCEDYDAEVLGTIYWQPFTQRFADETAGVYATVTLEVPVDSTCID